MKKQYVFAALLVCRLFVSLFLLCNTYDVDIPAANQPSIGFSAKQENGTPSTITYSL